MIAARVAAALLVTAGAALAEPRYTLLEFSDLDGWADDDHDAALSSFLETCTDLKDREWATLCAVAQNQAGGRGFFEAFFRPVLIEDGDPMLFTGYFEPELDGSLTQTPRYQWPIYAKPDEVTEGNKWFSRADIENLQLLQNRGLEIAWVDDPVELFFLQVQGSGRIRLPDGDNVRVGYAAKNGHEYRSVGQEMVRRGLAEAHEVSAATIRSWVKANPEEGKSLLQHNPSYVFFREVSEVPAAEGPLGAMNRSLTTMRSVAVDPDYTQLGAPIWIEKDGADPVRQLMIAQDTGSAIKGAQRADIFYGTGDEAGRLAGTIKDGGRMVALYPIQTALRLVPEG
ncbi:MAG: MltA domain-containing protein [Pseudomonadota bacterium]